MRSGIWGDRSSIGTDQNEHLLIFIQLSRDEIRHLRGQIKPRVRSKWKYTRFQSNYSNLFRQGIRHLGGQITHRNRSKWKWLIFKIHYLLLSSHQFDKGNVYSVLVLLISTKLTMMLLSWSGLSTLISLTSQIHGILMNILFNLNLS